MYLKKSQTGFTLIEILVTLLILSILLSLSIPEFKRYIEKNRVVNYSNDLLADIKRSRSFSIKNNTSVTLCASDDASQCSDQQAWSQGWLSFIDNNHNGSLDNNEVVLRQHPALLPGYQIVNLQSTALLIKSNGQVSTNIQMQACVNNRPDLTRLIVIEKLGHSFISIDKDGDGTTEEGYEISSC